MNQPKEQKWLKLNWTPLMECSLLISGTLQDKRNSEVLETVTTSMLIVPLSCLIWLKERLTEMSIDGTKTWQKSLQTFQFVWLVIKLILKTENWKPNRSISTERRTYNTMMYLLSPITNSRNLLYGSWDNWLVTINCNWKRILISNLLKSLWINSTFNRYSKRDNRLICLLSSSSLIRMRSFN